MAASFERRLYAHRGASAQVPENTIAAFDRALRDGATALETDVHLTSDGHVVISHDGSGRRRAGVDKLIARCTLDEVRGWIVGRTAELGDLTIPTLSEALERFPHARFNVDIKPRSASAALRVMRVIADHDAARRVTLASFHDVVLAALKANRYPGEFCLSPREVMQLVFAPLWLSRLVPPRGTAVQIPTHARAIRLDRREFIQRCHSLGLRVDYWVINDPDEAKRLLELGADGIVTNDPAAIAPVMGLARS
jgi:glycerophosphoryl diester phosphodiesterase